MKDITNYIQDVERKRLKKKLSRRELLESAQVSPRDWWLWTKQLKENEKRHRPNPEQKKRINQALIDLPARNFLIRGRPPGKLRLSPPKKVSEANA